MNRNRKALFSNFTFENWKNLILVTLISFYIIIFIVSFGHGAIGDDYMGYWSVGKIADRKGYSRIYDLNILRSVQTQEFKERGFLDRTDDPSFSPTLVPYLSFFVLPFQILSRVDLVYSFWIWIIFNLVILIGYLVFFLRRTSPGSGTSVNGLYVLVLMLISYPVFKNLRSGQINVFLLVCAGEFLRNAINKKAILSGIWLGGLLLKPQLLILIVPIFLIMCNWKVLMGLIVSSLIILMTSLLLSGFTGMKTLIDIWISVSFPSYAPGIMINWRMVGLNLNNLLNTSLGWVITGLGMVLTILAVYILVKQRPPFGSPQWVMAMLGVFSATLAITWHSHYYMAMVLIPFLIYASAYKMLPEKIIFLWGIVTPAAWVGMWIIDPFVLVVTKMNTPNYELMVIALSGLIVNLIILFYAMRYANNLNLKQY